MGLKDFNTAVNYFYAIPGDWQNPYSVHRDWYLSLALVAEGRNNEALAILSGLKSAGDIYSRKAAQIIRKMH